MTGMQAGVGRVGCVDVGGTVIKSGVLEGSELVLSGETPTPPPGDDIGARVVDAVVAVVGDLVATAGPLEAVGVVVPGVVDVEAGTGVWSANLGWRDVPFRRLLQDRLGIPVAFGHDVRTGGLAESRLGAAAGRRDVAFLALGTGIAAALVIDGVVLERPRPHSEIGHVDVGHSELCVCGLRGCLEAVASAAAVGRRYADRSGTPRTAAEVAGLVRAGDEVAVAVWTDAVDGLARAIAWLAALLAPDVVVVGGGLANAGATLFDPLRVAVGQRLSYHHRPLVVPATLGDRAGCVGAGLLAQDLLEGAR